jgi:hypothetical protein
MDEKDLQRALREGRIFHVGGSFLFAAQIPDDTVGCSGSRCSNCNEGVAYCNQRCEHCGFPFVGPSGFPQFPKWRTSSLEQRMMFAYDVYLHYSDRGRLGYQNVAYVPLTPEELEETEKIADDQEDLFSLTHSISPKEIKRTLFMSPI